MGKTFGEISKELNRSALYLHGLQDRFKLPTMLDDGYSPAYFAFLRTLVYLRLYSIPEESLLDLWHLEKKLLQLVHADSTGSSTWFLDSCGAKSHRERRLLLTNFDLGPGVQVNTIQLGLNFADGHPELFAGAEMGEDAIRILDECMERTARIRKEIARELPRVRTANRWAQSL